MYLPLMIGVLLKNLGAIEGRKKFQKIVHILQEFGVPFGLRYGFLHYGPYSEDLSDELENLKRDQLLAEEPVDSTFPTSRFVALPKFSELLEAVGIADMPSWINLARDLNGHPPRELEAVSTLLYLEKTENSEQRRDQLFRELKPSLVSQLPKAKVLLGKLKRNYQSVAA